MLITTKPHGPQYPGPVENYHAEAKNEGTAQTKGYRAIPRRSSLHAFQGDSHRTLPMPLVS